jgi:hypothetical protein
MDPDSFWHSLGGGALVAAALTVARLVLETALRGVERRVDHEERTRHHQRDAEARLERVLQDRLAEADRRLARSDLDLQAERVRCGTLEHEYGRLQQAHELLRQQYAVLLTERVCPDHSHQPPTTPTSPN